MSEQAFLPNILHRYGAPSEAILLFEGAARPEHLRYIDLFSASRADVRPDAVIELQGSPFLYVAKARHTIAPLRRALALRGDGSFFAIVEPGRITVLSLGTDGSDKPIEIVNQNDPSAASLIPRLALVPPSQRKAEAVHNLLFNLLDHATNTLADVGISPQDALSLAGRALFMRFLVDRHVVRDDDIFQICPSATRFEDCFETAENIRTTSAWLDETFNGDLLPLSFTADDREKPWFERLSRDAQQIIPMTLSTIMNRTEPNGQKILDWGDINFAHVPVGLLSQVYERHCQEHDPSAKSTSVHYTPRSIVEYMVDEAFSSMENPHDARVLDPAAGAGVFLVTAFRKLVEERWRHDGKRPTRALVRRILNEQLAGFEINESALRLAALSLYLTALELDPRPQPINDLRFEKLRGTVLFDVGDDVATGATGSLGAAVTAEHDGRYDLVIGNPPWTATKRFQAYRSAVSRTILPIVARRFGKGRSETFVIPDDVPDLAFLWRAAGWAKQAGHIAFAMHARLLFKQSPAGARARLDVFRGFRITGVLNGTSLQQTNVWPINAPFCLVFARNEPSKDADTFYYVSPEYERALNKRGRLRVDMKSAQVVRVADIERPSIFKVLFRGTPLDEAVLAKIADAGSLTLEQYWHANNLACGLGFQLGKRAGKQGDASELHHLPELTDERLIAFQIDTLRLPKFQRATLLRKRDLSIYAGPVVIIPQSPGAERDHPRAAVSWQSVAYDRTFFGFSCAGHRAAEDLARYLLVLFNSAIPFYTALLTSSQFGVERRTYLKDDIERQRIRPLEDLPSGLRRDMMKLSDELLIENAANYEAIDAWAAKVYGLNRWDREVVADTIAVCAPFGYPKERAQMPPPRRMVEEFVGRVCEQLRPFVASDRPLRGVITHSNEPWIWFDLLTSHASQPVFDINYAIGVADGLGATQILIPASNQLTIGLLAQTRYWTHSRARLLALELLERTDLLDNLTRGHVA